MSSAISLGAEFQSYNDFRNAIDEYCEEAAINGFPISFVRQSSKKLNTNSFKTAPTDWNTINLFVYQFITFICSNHKTRGGYCDGRIGVRYMKSLNVLQVTAFIGQHVHHATDKHEIANQRLQNIFTLIKQIPDDALTLVEQACQSILAHWGGDNSGLTVVITPIKDEPDPIPAEICEAQLDGEFVESYSNFSSRKM